MTDQKLYIAIFASSKHVAKNWAVKNGVSEKQFNANYIYITSINDVQGRYFSPGAIRLHGGYKFQTPEIMAAIERRTIIQEPAKI